MNALKARERYDKEQRYQERKRLAQFEQERLAKMTPEERAQEERAYRIRANWAANILSAKGTIPTEWMNPAIADFVKKYGDYN